MEGGWCKQNGCGSNPRKVQVGVATGSIRIENWGTGSLLAMGEKCTFINASLPLKKKPRIRNTSPNFHVTVTVKSTL